MPPSETSKIRNYIWPWVRDGAGLDVGCGADKVHPECEGLDAENHIGAVRGSAEKLPFDDEKFDWVYSSHCIEHLEQPAQAIAEMIRVIKPDGTLILYLPYADWYDRVYPNNWHKHQFRPSDILAMIKQHWPDMWIVTEELRGGPRKNDEQEYSFLLILQREEPKHPKKFYINNWPNIGDTASLDALLCVLPTKYPSCEIYLAHDNAKLFTYMSWVKVMPDISGVRWDGILNTLTIGQYHNYLRREKHFYAFPIWVAITRGWLTEEDIPNDPRPKPLKFTPDEEAWATKRMPEKKFVALVHHAGHFPRDWYNDRWECVVQWLTGHGFDVIAFGTKSPGFKMSGFTDLTGKSTVRQAVCLAARAHCVVGVDTGLFHLLPMFDMPCLVLSGPSRFDTTFSAPARPVYRNDAGCQQCYNAVTKDWFSEGEEFPIHSTCDCKHTNCMEAISVTRVIDALAEMLDIEDENTGLLSVCMIVHNEEQQLPKALASVHEHADEVVVVDTGSTDRTKEIAGGFDKVELYDYDVGDPIESFSAARNHAFSKATCKYVMWFDGSNTIEDLSVVTRALKDGNVDLIRLFTKSGDRTYRRDRVCLRHFAKFVDRVHETLSADGLRGVVVDAPITRTWMKKVGREDSVERNIRLLRLMISENEPKHPRYARWVFYLAKELQHCGQTDEAFKLYQRRVELGSFWEERALSVLEVVKILKSRGQYKEAIKAAYECLKFSDGWRDPYYLIGDCYYHLKNYKRAIAWLNHTLEVPRPKTVLWQWGAVYEYLPQLLLSHCFERLGDIPMALRWAGKELAGAPKAQHHRINGRIAELEGRLKS